MELILHWVQSNQGLAWVGSWILGIGVVSLFLKKYAPKIRKFIKIGKEGLSIIDTLLDAIQDDKITDEEVKTILKEVQDFKTSLQ